MSRPWMPLYIADYLADTAHLRALESGAYLHLIMHYWQHGSLPFEDRKLAAIAKLTDSEWRKNRSTLATFFKQPGWNHARIDVELAEAEEKYQRRARAGRNGGNAAKLKQCLSNATSNATAEGPPMLNQPQPHTPNGVHGGGDARASATSLISTKAWKLAEEIAAIVGFQTLGDWPPAWLGAPYRVQAMLDNGWKPEIMLASTREVMARRGADPPDNIKYFEKAFARAHAQQNAPLPVVKPLEAETTHATSRRGGHAISPITAALDKHLERFERQARDDDEVRETAPRLLSNG